MFGAKIDMAPVALGVVASRPWVADEALGCLNTSRLGGTERVASTIPDKNRHGYREGVLGHTEVTCATARSLDVTFGPVTLYGARLNLIGHPPEDFFTVSTQEAPKFLAFIAGQLRVLGKVDAAAALDSVIEAARKVFGKSDGGFCGNVRGDVRGNVRGHAKVGLETGIYLYGPAGKQGQSARILMQAFADWKQGKQISLQRLDDVGFGMYVTPTAGAHFRTGPIFKTGVHGFWGVFAGFRVENNNIKPEFFTVGEGAVGLGIGPVQFGWGKLYFRSFDHPENSHYKTNPIDVISLKDPISGQRVAVRVPTGDGVDASLWRAALKWNRVNKSPDITKQQPKGANSINRIAPMSYRAFMVYTKLKHALTNSTLRQAFHRSPDDLLKRMFPGYPQYEISEASKVMQWERATGLDYMRTFAVAED